MTSHRHGSWTARIASTDAAAAGAASIYYPPSPGTSRPPPRPIPRAPRRPPPLPASAETTPEPRGEPAGRRSKPRGILVQRQYSAIQRQYNGPQNGGAKSAHRSGTSDGGGPAKHTLHAADDVLGLMRGEAEGFKVGFRGGG